MADKTGIEWSDATLNIVTGCTRVSEGCDHCYIERTPPLRMAGRRFDGTGPGSTTGVLLHPERLQQALRWQRPRRIFMPSLADLFHDDVPDDLIAEAWSVMARTPRHTWQITTKRPARMRSLLARRSFRDNLAHLDAPWPLPNVWLGVSVENQRWADVRVPLLLDTPAAVRWLSCEPLLGPVDLLDVPDGECGAAGPAVTHHGYSRRTDYGTGVEYDCEHESGIDWVVVGGESGPGARPMDPDWARSLRDQCAAAGVPFLFKQWGESAPLDQLPPDAHASWEIRHGQGYPGATLCHVGKKAAGRELDGRTWDEYPAARSAEAVQRG